MTEVVSGCVLNGDEIAALSAPELPAEDRLILGLKDNNLKGAAYDLRMADDGMVLPDGTVIKPGEPTHRSAVILAPGQTIFVSTQERVNMPATLTGNMSIKGELASHGLLSLTGLIVDPGYRSQGNGDGRLHFRLANFGSRPVVLEPGKTKIASIQFLRLGAETQRLPGTSFRDIWERTEELKEGLGFIEDLRKLESRCSALEGKLASQERTLNTVVVAAIFVIIATLLGVGVSAFLSLGSDSQIVRSARNILPHNGGGKILFVVGIFGFAAVAWALASAARVGRVQPDFDPSSVQTRRSEAARVLRVRRWRSQSAALLSLALITTICVALVTTGTLAWYVSTILGLAVGLRAVQIGRPRIWWPISRWDVDRELARWEVNKGPL